MAPGGRVSLMGVFRRKTPATHSECVQVRSENVSKDAVAIFNQKANGKLPLVIIPTPRSNCSMLLRVPSGVYCLVQKFGKDVGEIGEGLHFKPAYWRIAYVVTKQSCTYDAPVRACPTQDDVMVEVDCVVIFKITDPKLFVYHLGAKNFDDYLKGTVDEAIRMMVRKETYASVYSLRSDTAQTLLQILNEKFNESGVTFEDVKVTSVWLPDKLAECLEKTTKVEKKMDKIARQHEFEVLNIKQDYEMKLEMIRRKTEQVLVAEEGRKTRANIDMAQSNIALQERGAVALLNAKEVAEKMLKEVGGKLQRTQTKLETYRIQEISKAEIAANTQKEHANLDEEKTLIAAARDEEMMVSGAEAIKAEADCEKATAKFMTETRRHQMELREKDILAKLAQSGQLSLVGTTGDKLISAMMSGSMKDVNNST